MVGTHMGGCGSVRRAGCPIHPRSAIGILRCLLVTLGLLCQIVCRAGIHFTPPCLLLLFKKKSKKKEE